MYILEAKKLQESKKLKMKLSIGIIVVVLLVGGLFLFSGGNLGIREEIGSQEKVENSSDEGLRGEVWYEAELINVQDGERFQISDFEGTPVLIESFAVWCPTCTRQQKITKEFHEEVGESVVSISLDTDQSEDESLVREHTERNGFDWIYAVSPIEVTESLISDFGPGIVSAPSVPMILICENGKAEKLGSGLKSVNELKEAVASCNN
jgi:thiol-disulfide isomerase/thioredoxin